MLSIVKGPYLQWPTESAMTVMWETNEPASSEVRVYEAERIHSGYRGNFNKPEKLLMSAEGAGKKTIHRVTVEGLSPDTYYFYEAVSKNGAEVALSEAYPFKAAAPAGTSFSFAATSETGGYSGFDLTEGRINRDLFAQMKRYRPDIALFAGDIVDDGTKREDWDKYFFSPGKELLASTPSYSCLGNHENNGEGYYDYFAFAPPRRYYSFDYGDVHFVCLDSTDFIPPETYPHASREIGPGHPQYDFLENDLRKAAAAKWKVVFFHYSPYVSGGYEVEELRKLCPVLERYGVDLVITSHTIMYERSHPLREGRIDEKDGIVYVVAGGAGAMEEWLLPKRAWHTSQAVAVPHFVQAVVTPGRMELRAIDDRGRLFDRLLLVKDGEGGKSFL